MSNYRFSHAQKYAIWLRHGKRCYVCTEPLRLVEVTIDHVIPERLLNDDVERDRVFGEYGLDGSTFQINGYENWLPAHYRCNQEKSGSIFEFVPAIKLRLSRLSKLGPSVQKTAERVLADARTQRALANVLDAVATGNLTNEERETLLAELRDVGTADTDVIESELLVRPNPSAERLQILAAEFESLEEFKRSLYSISLQINESDEGDTSRRVGEFLSGKINLAHLYSHYLPPNVRNAINAGSDAQMRVQQTRMAGKVPAGYEDRGLPIQFTTDAEQKIISNAAVKWGVSEQEAESVYRVIALLVQECQTAMQDALRLVHEALDNRLIAIRAERNEII
ncbi:hypothetical protein AM1_0143 [Acaryochloris marina MBIC11017]|uniref:HNH nuclease domain-containing protein n=1 Tax=Acaryochloris marina (strain MBIC 11017) TaxID=329726 RepID=B0C6D5_ACAM1|nr:hypothetical protein AM1_0143 [Acaryochloris marina MBIC11017]